MAVPKPVIVFKSIPSPYVAKLGGMPEYVIETESSVLIGSVTGKEILIIFNNFAVKI